MNLFIPNISRQLRSATSWLFVGVVLFATAARSWGAVAPIYQNFQTTTNWPAIDATVFDNRGVFFDILTTFPADMTDTKIFLNRGDMNGEVGFRFDTVTATNRKCALAFTNYESGTIQGLDSPLNWFGQINPANGQWLFTEVRTPASYCLVNATNIVNRGLMSCGNIGLIRFNGRDIDLERGTLAAGEIADLNTNIFLTSFSVFGLLNQTTGRGFTDGTDHFIAPPHVYDLFWGAQAAKKFDSSTLAASTNVFTNFFGFGNSGFRVSSPVELVRSRTTANGIGFVGSESIPLDFTASMDAKAFVNAIPNNTGFDYYINVIFVRTNANDTNVQIDAEFSPGGGFFNVNATNINAATDIVRFAVTNVYDVTTGQYVDNAFYLLDSGALENPIVMTTNVASANQYGRPSSFEITTATPAEWFSIFTNDFFVNGQTNLTFGEGVVPYDPTLIYNSVANGGTLGQGKYENKDVSYTSGIYGAQVGRNPETVAGVTLTTNRFFFGLGGFNNFNLVLPDASNDVPRIEINATNLDLTAASLRSEGILALNSKHLFPGGLAGVDAGSLNGTLGSTNGTLEILKVVPTEFKRVRGDVYAWSGTWNNVATNSTQTNNLFLHVLIVDHELRGSYQPTFQNIALHGTNTIIEDNLRVVKTATFDAEFLDINSTVHLTEQVPEFTRATVPHLKDMLIDTNGALQVDDTALIGWDVAKGINSFINHGLLAATAPLIKANYVQNTGEILATNGGSMIIQADTVDLIVGPMTNVGPTNTLVADRDIEIDAATVNVTNSAIVAGQNGTIGKLTLNVTDSLSDFVPNLPGTTNVLINFWQVNNGITVPQKPDGDLFGTEIVCAATNRNQSQIIWPAEDVGAGSDGFNNNLVIGRLVLDRQSSNSSIHISAAGDQNAMYVDFLELRDFSSDDYRNGLFIDPNMTVYFAASNFPEPDKLQNIFAGRLVWANSFAGPNSTAAVPRSDGSICLMNQSLAQSRLIDSDNDGTPNAKDAFPLDNLSDPSFSLACPGDTLTTSFRTFLTDNHGTGPLTSFSVSVTGGGKVTPQQKSPVVQLGHTYNLHAIPNPGNLFAGWSGSINTTQPNISFTLSSNMVLNARFVTNPFIALKGNFTGLFYDTNNITMDSAGSVSFLVDPNGGFSGHLGMNTASSVPFGGHFDVDGNATSIITRGKKPSLTLTLKLDTTGGSQQITGTIACDTNWTANLIADRSVFNGRNPAPFTGNYTFALQGTNDPNAGPAGDSYGTPFINRVGTLSSVIHLADGITLSPVVGVSKDGNWPLFLSVFGREIVIGWVHIDGSGVMSGTVNWIRNPATIGNYRAGFTNAVSLTGSIWVAPKNGTSGLKLTNPVITLSGGNLVSDLTPAVTFNTTNLTFSSTNPQLSLKLSPNTGFISGRFTDPASSRVRQLNGVMLQNQNNARGFFLGADQSGAVRLENP
ncbi:MAG: InlB B-repeat-containing protein [Limisphaerales bacterium]